MNNMNSKEMESLMERALRKGAEVIMQYFGQEAKAVVKENISSVVTRADTEAEQVIMSILDEGRDPCNLLGEESGFADRGSAYTWVIDPLDGTSNFAAGLPWFGVLIALFSEERPVLAGMYLPVDDILYIGAEGKGCYKNGRRVSASSSELLSENLIAYSFDYSDEPGKTAGEMRILEGLSGEARNVRSTNSLVDFCFVTDGRLGGTVNQNTKIWDIAAPWLLIREAGGRVTDIRGRDIRFALSAASAQQNYTILAAGNRLHGDLLRIVEKAN